MNDDNFEIIKGRQCLKDGHRYRVPMKMRDSAPKTIVHDGHGNPVGHRPGFVVATEPPNAAQRQAAYDAYHDNLESAYKDTATNPTDDPDEDDPPRRRRVTEEDHQTKMAKLYDGFDQQLREAWRRP